MASGATSTLKKELRIELQLVTQTFLRQTRIAARALDILNNRFDKTKTSAMSTGDAFAELAREAREVSSPEITQELQDKSKALADISKNASSASSALNKYSKSATTASTKTTKMKDNIKKSRNELSRLEKGAKSARTAIGGFAKAAAGAVLVQAGRKTVELALDYERVKNRMKAATNSSEEYNKSMRLASNLANKLGVDLVASSRGYATLIAATRGSGVEGAVTNQLFESILKTSAALSLTADETNSVILAFGQVASKGRAAAEEIRGQIGERIPAYYTNLAKALGLTQKELTKLLDQGLLSSDQALKASAIALEKAFGKKALDNANSLAAQWLRIKNLVVETGAAIGQWALENSIVFKLLDEIAKLRATNADVADSTGNLLPNLEKEVDALTQKFDRGTVTFAEYNEGLRRLSAQYTNIASQSGLDEEELEKYNKELEKLTGFAARTDFSKRLFTANSILKINQTRLETQKLAKATEELANKEKAKATATFFNAFNKGYSLIAKGAQKAVEEAKKLPAPLLNKLAFLTDEQKIPYAEQIEYIKNLGLLDDKLKQIIESAEQIGDVKNPELLDDKLKQIIESAKQIGNIKNFGSLDDELKKIIESAEQIGDVKNLDLLDGKLKRIIESAKKIGNTKNLELLSDEVKQFIESTKVEDIKNLRFLDDKQQILYAEQIKQYALQKKADKDRLNTLQEQLKTLKEQKEALKGGTGKVNFIEAIQAGSAASIKLGIEARARAAGAADGSKELLQEIDLGIKRVGDEIEELKNNLKVENA